MFDVIKGVVPHLPAIKHVVVTMELEQPGTTLEQPRIEKATCSN